MKLVVGNAHQVVGSDSFLKQVVEDLRDEVSVIRERAVCWRLAVAMATALFVAGFWGIDRDWFGAVMAFIATLGIVAVLMAGLSRLAARVYSEDDIWAAELQSWAFDNRVDLEDDQRIAAKQLLICYLVRRLNQIDGTEQLQRGLDRMCPCHGYRRKQELPIRWQLLSVEQSLRSLQMLFGEVSNADLYFLWESGLRLKTVSEAEGCREAIQSKNDREIKCFRQYLNAVVSDEVWLE